MGLKQTPHHGSMAWSGVSHYRDARPEVGDINDDIVIEKNERAGRWGRPTHVDCQY